MKLNLTLASLLLIFSIVLLPPAALLAADDNVIISAEEIATLQAHSMADILNNVPGLTAGNSSVSIHGNYKVKVFVDGKPINDPTSSHGRINWHMITPSDISKIEILRGKGSVKYGQDASGGVILITTKGGSKISGNLKSFGGSQERYYLNTTLQTTLESWHIGLTGSYETTDGYLDNNDKQRSQLGSTIGYTFHEQAHISFAADFTEDNRGRAGYPDFPTPFSRAESRMAAYSMQADVYGIESKTYLNIGEKTNTDISRNLFKTIEVKDFGQQLDSTYISPKTGTFNYGGSFFWSGASGNSFSDQDETTASLYLVDSYTLDSLPLNISLGLRGNVNSAFNNAYNPEIKITYKEKYWKTTAGYNRSNNSPSFYQRFNETSSTQPNPNLGMETSDNYSLAIFSRLTETVSGSTTLFYHQLSNRITYTYDDNGTGQYQNVGKATYTGCDLSLNWQPFKGIQNKINYTYLLAKDEQTNNDLPAKPRHKGRVTLTYKPTQPLSLILIGRGSSSAYRNRANSKSVPGYVVGDFKIEYSFQRCSLFSEITNILDKEYWYVDGLLARPRAWFAGITFRI